MEIMELRFIPMVIIILMVITVTTIIRLLITTIIRPLVTIIIHLFFMAMAARQAIILQGQGPITSAPITMLTEAVPVVQTGFILNRRNQQQISAPVRTFPAQQPVNRNSGVGNFIRRVFSSSDNNVRTYNNE